MRFKSIPPEALKKDGDRWKDREVRLVTLGSPKTLDERLAVGV